MLIFTYIFQLYESLKIRTIFFNLVCPEDVTDIGGVGEYSWGETAAGSIAELSCICVPGSFATRLCGIEGTWESPNVQDCQVSNQIFSLCMTVSLTTYILIPA